MQPENYLYHYNAIVRSVYDGDTLRLDIDLGLKTWELNQSCRLRRVDAPEIRGAEKVEGLKAKEAVQELLPTGQQVLIRTHLDKAEKYGRLLVDVFIPTADGFLDLNQHLLETGLAVPLED
jgi:micrococcal nuclease